MVVGLMSMFPNLVKLEKNKDSCDVKDKNLIFYGDIASYKSGEKYIQDLYRYYEKSTISVSELSLEEKDYAGASASISKEDLFYQDHSILFSEHSSGFSSGAHDPKGQSYPEDFEFRFK